MINFIHYKHFIIINVRLEGEPENNVHGAAAAVCRECRTGVHTAQAHTHFYRSKALGNTQHRPTERDGMDGWIFMFVCDT